MRLWSMLQTPGGVAEQGREVQIRLRYLSSGVPHQRDVTAQMHPLSEVDAALAETLARQVVAQGGKLPYAEEYVVQFLRASLRDPADPSKLLLQDERDLQVLRDGLVGPQYAALLGEYRELMRTEYPDVVTKEDVAELEKQARDFSSSDQPARG